MAGLDAIEVLGAVAPEVEAILTPEALAFVAALQRQFGERRLALLQQRVEIQRRLDDGWRPDFLPETAAVRAGDWTVAPIPHDLQQRVVEITGPVDRKMIINAMNSGADVFMADFEDSTTPTWDNVTQGQLNLRDAVRGTIDYYDPARDKHYRLGDDLAVLMVRPRGWHLPEKHVRVDGQPMSGSLFDFGLFFFHNAQALVDRGTGPYFYLPKLESHHEARLWNDVFDAAQQALGIPHGTIRATVLIENILASFQMDEILYALRDHSAGLNCGRWDYIFSYIKKFKRFEEFVLPDRAQVTMDKHFLNAYCQLLIRTCHHRGVHAMGGMAAQIPITRDPAANEQALARVRADKVREVNLGHDGTWVAHPGLVPVARQAFEAVMTTPNQLDRQLSDVTVTAEDLLRPTPGTITEKGFRHNINVGVLYLEAWLGGTGCVPLYHLMEDAATSEICRTQLWQWVHHQAAFDDGRVIDRPLFEAFMAQEVDKIRQSVGDEAFVAGRFQEAAALFAEMVLDDAFTDFLTLPAYDRIAPNRQR